MSRIPRAVIVCNDPELGGSLGRFYPGEAVSLVVRADSDVIEVLVLLSETCFDSDLLIIDAQLQLKEYETAVCNGGIELFKHLRLTPGLGAVSSRGVILLSTEPLGHLLQRQTDNLILCSPGCEVIELPWRSPLLTERFFSGLGFASADAMQAAMKSFITITSADRDQLEHNYWSRYGVWRFIKEFAGDVPDILDPSDWKSAKASLLFDELWMKKMRFLHPESYQAESIDISFTLQFRERVCGYSFAYIDDQHDEGWSYGLYAGLTGEKADWETFLQPDPRIATTDGRLVSICSMAEAEAFVDRLVGLKSELVSKLAQAMTEDRPSYPKSISPKDSPVEINSQEIPNIIFLDLRLSRRDQRPQARTDALSGFRLLKRLKRKVTGVPVIILTASQKALSVRESQAAGADGFWIKGISSGEELQRTVLQAIQKADLFDYQIAVEAAFRLDSLEGYQWDPYKYSDARGDLGRLVSRKIGCADLDADDRSLIHLWLTEAIQLLANANDIKKHSRRTDYPYNQVVLNMALIQEVRFNGLANQSHSIRSQAGFSLDTLRDDDVIKYGEEWGLRERRRDAVHANPGAKRFERIEAMQWLKFTIERLVGRSLPSLPSG